MHDCYDLGIIDHDTLTSFLRFCVQFWMGHYRMKKQQFDMNQREIEQEEKKKLAAIIAEKEAWHKLDNSTPRVVQKTVKELEEMGEQLEGVCRDTSIIITKTTAKETAANSIQDNSSKPISGGYDGIKMSNEADNNNNNDNTQQQPMIRDNESDIQEELSEPLSPTEVIIDDEPAPVAAASPRTTWETPSTSWREEGATRTLQGSQWKRGGRCWRKTGGTSTCGA